MKLRPHIQPIFTILLILCSLTTMAQSVRPGIEQLEARQFDILKGKRVGLITNPTGIDSKLKTDHRHSQ
jgi:uncharacterized protein YbbC (DUF1343 family)